MDSDPRRFAAQLRKSLPAVVLVACEERIDQEEVGDEVLRIARAAGFAERTTYHVDRKGFAWGEILADAGAMSLFSSQRIVDVRAEKKFLDRDYVAFALEIAANPPPDTLLLIRTEYLNNKTRAAKWYKALVPHMLAVHAYLVKDADMPRWLGARAQQEGVQLQRDALEFLAQRLEGNLFAAAQELARLKLLGSNEPLSLSMVRDTVAAANHYQVWDLLDGALGGDVVRVQRMCATLRAEGEHPLAPLASLVMRLRAGGGGGRGFGGEGVAAAVGKRGVQPYLAECALIDLQAKGGMAGDAWQSLERLLLALAGLPTTPSLHATHRHLTTDNL